LLSKPVHFNLPIVKSSMDISIREEFKRLRTCVLVPTYNNSKTLGKLLQELSEYTDQIIVVNDGSTDTTTEILAQFQSLHQINYKTNVGKGWALRCGFKKALELGFQYAITIDSDGQHFPEDLPNFLSQVEKNPGCLIIGKRNMEQAGIPGKSSFGNKFSNFWYWVETGYTMGDTQSGYRLYPIELLQSMKFFTRKFEFEIEVIVRAAWKGILITAVPVKIFYEEKAKRISHFRPFQDFSRISVLNAVLVTIALVYIKPRDFIRRLLKKETRQELLKQLFNPDDSHYKKATSIGFGIFMGIVPIWGFQLITAIALAVLFRMNKALVILAANISFPPFIPFILYLSHVTGKFWMGEKAVEISFNKGITLQVLHNSFVQYVLGAITLSIVCGLLATSLSLLYLKLVKRTSPQA
jgi:glycosyltransferase involved in cell wall biosynthesis